MSTSLLAKPRSLLRRYLVAGYALFIAYASLSPFTGWQEQGLEFWAVLTSPLGLTYTWLDALSNLLAYLPFGLLLGLTFRSHFDARRSIGLALFAALAVSCTAEYLQMYLPSRTSSNADILSNGVGALAGALLAVSIVKRAWFERMTQWRIGLFRQGAEVDFGLALVMLWMFAQINPSLPMLGNVFITGVAPPFFAEMPQEPFNGWESLAVALNLSMVGSLLLMLLRERRHVVAGLVLILVMVGLTKFIAAALLLKSWALLLWLNGEAMLGLVGGVFLIGLLGWLRKSKLVWLAIAATLSYMILVYWVLDSGTPSAAMRLYQWRVGHLRNYNGLSQMVSLIFPLLFAGYLAWAHAAPLQGENEDESLR